MPHIGQGCHVKFLVRRYGYRPTGDKIEGTDHIQAPISVRYWKKVHEQRMFHFVWVYMDTGIKSKIISLLAFSITRLSTLFAYQLRNQTICLIGFNGNTFHLYVNHLNV